MTKAFVYQLTGQEVLKAQSTVFGDGLHLFASAVPEGGVYQNRQKIDIAPGQTPSSTVTTLALLQGALTGDVPAQTATRHATQAMFDTQHLIFL